MRAASPDVKLTYDGFVLFPDDGKRHELIDGEHFATPSPNTKHQVACSNLHWLLRSSLHDHPSSRVFFAPFDVVLSAFDVVERDLLYTSHERARQILTGDGCGRPIELSREAGDTVSTPRLPAFSAPRDRVFDIDS